MATLRFEIDGLNCGACAARAEKAMAAVGGVVTAHVNFADHTATVEAPKEMAVSIAEASGRAGYPAQVMASTEHTATQDGDMSALRRQVVLAVALTLPLFVVEMGGHLFPPLHHWVMANIGANVSWGMQFVLATLILVGPGRGFYRLGVPALWRGTPDMNSLVVLGATAAWGYSTVATFVPSVLPDGAVAVYFEAAGVIVTLILLGRLLEARAKGRTGAAVKRLIGLRPDTAHVERDDVVHEIPLGDVVIGDVVHLAAGARVPVDGVVLQGQGAIDEAMISGEPIPQEKGIGDVVAAGTVNGNSAMIMKAQAVGTDTMLARIIDMVAQAQGARLPVQDLVNRITLWFVPVVMMIAVVTVVAWLNVGSLNSALVAGVSVLIIACPCAMGLATPTSIMVGTGRAAELGVLFRRGTALQELQGVDIVAFDKTGTLTKGTPKVVGHTLNDDMLAAVAAIERQSSHPLAGAIVSAANGLPFPEVESVETLPGLGVMGHIGGETYAIGNGAMMARQGIVADIEMNEQGLTQVFVAIGANLIGALLIEDQVKPEALKTIAALKAKGMTIALISGDTIDAARRVANELGIENVIADVRPDGKVDAVKALQLDGKVAFVGDGINDAPALATADVGIAMGNGTDVAIEAADVVLVSGNPLGVARGVEVSRRTLRNIWQNLGWAFGYNVVLIPIAALGLLTPQLAALAMAASSVLVVSNALRLRWVQT